MLETDEDAVFCDIAETYHLFDWSAVSVSTLARLASGLRDDARIIMRLSGQTVKTEHLLLATIADNTGFVAWSKTESAHRNPTNPPERIAAKMLGIKPQDRKSVQGFATVAEFEAKLATLRGS